MDPTAGARAPRSSGLRSRLGPRHAGVVVGLLVGAIVMLVVAALGDTTGAHVPVLSGLAAAPVPQNQRPLAERTPPPATPGSCLTWQRDDAADAVLVDCGQPHLFEQAGPVQLAGYAPTSPLPDNATFRKLVNDKCTPMVEGYLGGKYDPDGAFRAGALKPSQKSWSEGDRSMRCGLQRFSRSGALYPISGKVAAQDQSDIRPAGTCLGIDGRFIGDPVDCSLPHAVESVGAVDLGQKFTGKFPGVGDQDGYLQPACTKLASGYGGGDDVVAAKGLSVMWDNLSPESWAAGTRKVSCNLAAQLPDKSGFAPVVGTVKGPVKVGSQPAPPAKETAPVGAPAPGSGGAQGTDDGKAQDSGGGGASGGDLPGGKDAPQVPTLKPPVPLPDNPLEGNRGGGGGGGPLGGANGPQLGKPDDG
ncbi:MAG TPA: septum formation family protein [Pseudonocardia sp.]